MVFYFEIHDTKSVLFINGYYYLKFEIHWDVVPDLEMWVKYNQKQSSKDVLIKRYSENTK